MQCHNLLHRRIADALRDLLDKARDVGTHGIIEQAVDCSNARRLDKPEHDLVRAHRERDNAFRRRREIDDRPLDVRNRIGRGLMLCRVRRTA